MPLIDPNTYATAVRLAVRRKWPTVNSCIESVRVGIEVARYFGLMIEPVPVKCCFATLDWYAAFTDHQAPPLPGWSVGTTGAGNPTGPNRWDGHLIGYAPLADLLIDYSADQYHRPQHGLNVPGPVVMQVDRARLRAGFAARWGEIMVDYKQITDRAWSRGGGWTGHHSLISEAAGEAIRALRPRAGVR